MQDTDFAHIRRCGSICEGRLRSLHHVLDLPLVKTSSMYTSQDNEGATAAVRFLKQGSNCVGVKLAVSIAALIVPYHRMSNRTGPYELP